MIESKVELNKVKGVNYPKLMCSIRTKAVFLIISEHKGNDDEIEYSGTLLKKSSTTRFEVGETRSDWVNLEDFQGRITMENK